MENNVESEIKSLRIQVKQLGKKKEKESRSTMEGKKYDAKKLLQIENPLGLEILQNLTTKLLTFSRMSYGSQEYFYPTVGSS